MNRRAAAGWRSAASRGVALAVVLACGPSFAGVIWENRTAELTAAPADQRLEAHYSFRNMGDRPVKIRGFHTSCGCTAASAAKDEIAPGAKGEVTVVFDIQGRIGRFNESAEVEIEGEKDDAMLALTVVVPAILKLEPLGPLFWKDPEPLRAKEVIVRLEAGVPAATMTATSSNAKFSVLVNSLPDGRSFKLVVTPGEDLRTAARPVGTVIAIKTRFPSGEGRTVTFIAQCRK
jgi:hypothetical protein